MDAVKTLSSPSENSSPKQSYCLTREERIRRKKIIDLLFDKTSPSFTEYPLRIIFHPLTEDEEIFQKEAVSLLFSVSKRHFKSAVKRNRIKRQLREAYRLQKNDLMAHCQQHHIKVCVAILWTTRELLESKRLHYKMEKCLSRLQKEILNIQKVKRQPE